MAAIGVLIWLPAWAAIAVPRPPLGAAAARPLIAEEFQDARPGGVWVAADGQAAIARAGAPALVVYLRGDDYVARPLAWRDLAAAQARDGAVSLAFHDVAPPPPGSRRWRPRDQSQP